MKTSRPIYMPELAVELWPDTYDLSTPRDRETARGRARRFLRRLEQQRKVVLLFFDGHRLYTTKQLLSRHASELIDWKGWAEREIRTLCEGQRLEIRSIRKALGALAARQRRTRHDFAASLEKMNEGLKGLEGCILEAIDGADSGADSGAD